MPLKKPSEFYVKNPNSSLDDIRENATADKVETISEAFNSFKTNFDHIQALTEFTNTFDTFKNNVEKVETLSENVEEIREGIQDLISKEDLNDAMTAQLLFVEESIRNVQNKVKTLNSKSVLGIKEEFGTLSAIVNEFIGEEVPSYKKLIVDSETRVDNRFGNFKDDLTLKVEEVHEDIYATLNTVTSQIESLNEDTLVSVKEEVTGIRGKVESLLEKVLPKYKRFFAETEVKTEQRIIDNKKFVIESVKNLEDDYKNNLENIEKGFERFAENYKKNLVESKLKTEKEVKSISSHVDNQVSFIKTSIKTIEERIDNKEIELDKNLLEKTSNIENLVENFKELSSTYENLHKDFKKRERAENKKLEGYEETLTGFSNKMNKMEETLSDNICELQENLDTSTSKYYNEMKDSVVPAVVNFEKNLSGQLREMRVDFAVNEKHVDNLQNEFKSLLETIRVDELIKEVTDTNDKNLSEVKTKLEEKVNHLEELITLQEENKLLQEGLLNIPPDVKNSDPLTPLNQEYVTLEQLQQHYRLFINRVQDQLATFGGGGARIMSDLEDVDYAGTGISTDGWVLAWDSDINMWAPAAGGSAGAGGTWGSSTAGVSTTKNVGVATTARANYSLYVGESQESGVTTSVVAYFDGDISVAGTIFKNNVVNVDSLGIVTARSGVDVGYDYDGGSGIGITLKPSGNAVFAGIVTAASDVYIGGDLNVTGDLVYDEATATNLDVSGIATISRLGVSIAATTKDLEVTGVSTFSGGEVTVGTGLTITSGGNAVFAGVVTASTMFYPPVMTSTVRDAASVTVGALIFNTTTAQLEIYNGTAWVGVGGLNNLTITNL